MTGALGASFAQRYAEAALRFVLLVALARLVDPSAFGQFAVAAALVVVPQTLARSGATAWIVRAESGEAFGVRAPMLLCAGVSFLAGAGIAVAAGPLTRLVGVPSAAPLLTLFALSFAVLPVEVVFGALLRRRMAFGRLAIIGIVAVVVGGFLSVGTAAAGWEGRALVLGSLAEQAMIALGCLVAARDGLPLLKQRGADLTELAIFSARLGVGNTLGNLGKVVAPLVIGGTLGSAAVGLYDRARRISLVFSDLVLNAVKPVVLPALAAERRAGRALAGPYEFKLQALSLAAWPFFAGLAICAEPAVRLLLGPDWSAAVPLVQVACLFGLPLPYHAADASFLVAAERERAYLRVQLIAQVVAVAGIVIGARYGVAAAMLGYLGGRTLKAILTSAVLGRALGLAPRRQLAAGGHSALAAVVTAAAAAAALRAAEPVIAAAGGPGALGALLALAAAGTAGLAACALTVLIVGHPARAALIAAAQQATGRLGAARADARRP